MDDAVAASSTPDTTVDPVTVTPETIPAPETAPTEISPSDSATTEETGDATTTASSPQTPRTPNVPTPTEGTTSSPATTTDKIEPTPTPSPTPTPTPVTPEQTIKSFLLSLLQKARIATTSRNKRRTELIWGLFTTQQKVTNHDVQKLLKVSNTTAWRYLSKLEAEGKIKQVGKTGHTVTYIRNS